MSGLTWAALDILRKRLADRASPLPLAAALLSGQVPVMALWVWQSGAGLPDAGYLRAGGALICLNLTAQVAFAAALRAGDLSLTVPMLSFTPVWSALLGWGLAGEALTIRQATGIGCAVAGALTLHAGRHAGSHAGPDRRGGPLRLLSALWGNRGARAMLGVSVLFSLTITLDKLALAHAARPVHAAIQCTGAALGLLGLLAARGELHRLNDLRPVWRTWLLAVACFSLAAALQLLALQHSLISVVEATKRAIGMTSALIAGRIWLGEPLSAEKLIGAGLMGVGVALVLL